MSSPVLRLDGIEKSYNLGKPNEISVLRGVGIEISAGETVGMLAPSGAGKSTLLHVAGLLDVPDSGVIEIDGVPMSDSSERVRTRTRRREIGFVYQFHHLLPEFTALENVLLPQLANGASRSDGEKRSAELLDSVGLARRASHRPAELSGGEQQRVAICRALANRPKLLLADEPTGNLDLATSDLVFGMLLEAAKSHGLSALIATHNTSLAKKMDRSVRLCDGLVN